MQRAVEYLLTIIFFIVYFLIINFLWNNFISIESSGLILMFSIIIFLVSLVLAIITVKKITDVMKS